METELRLGLVGYGGRGRGLLQLATQSFPGVKAAAICDIDSALLDKAKAEHPNAALFTEFDRMLDGAPFDAMLVETPAALHAEFCSKALSLNIHVMSDVPCVDTPEQAKQLWDAQERSRAFYMIGANPNMWGFVEFAVDLKCKGLLGDPYYVETEYIHDVRELFPLTAREGGRHHGGRGCV